MFMNALDGSIVNVALPDIQRSLHFTQSGLTWVVDAYLISFGSFLLMAGRLGDLIGRKKVFLAGVALFTLASIACGSADSQAMLVAARFVQGIGGALSSSVIVAIIVTEFPSRVERAKAMSAYVFVAVGGGSIGLLAGGVLTQALSWHWIFFVNVPIGIATLILGRLLVVENIGLGIKQGVDVVGSVLVTLSLMVGIYGIVTASSDGWGSAHTLVILGVAVLLFLSFILLESRLANPIMPLRILKLRTLDRVERDPGVARHGHVLDLLHRRALPRACPRVQPHQDRSGLHAGDGGHGDHVGRAHGAPGQPVRHQGDVPGHAPRRGRLGPAVASAGQDAPYFPKIFFAFLMLGVGAGASFMPLLQIGMSEIPNADAGLGSGIVNVSQQMAAPWAWPC